MMYTHGVCSGKLRFRCCRERNYFQIFCFFWFQTFSRYFLPRFVFAEFPTSHAVCASINISVTLSMTASTIQTCCRKLIINKYVKVLSMHVYRHSLCLMCDACHCMLWSFVGVTLVQICQELFVIILMRQRRGLGMVQLIGGKSQICLSKYCQWAASSRKACYFLHMFVCRPACKY
jgi:hypothetical protein